MRRQRSRRGRLAGLLVRAFSKRRPAATAEGLARQARNIFGLPAPLAGMWARFGAVSVEQTNRGIPCERLVARGRPSTMMLYLHGGGYLCCSAKTQRPNTVTLTRLLDAETWVPDYRLAPEHPFPAAVEDAMVVYEQICAAVASEARLVLAGDSAGGGLALAVAIRARDQGLRSPSAILTLSPWVDLTPGREQQLREREQLCDMFYAESIAAYSHAYLQGADPRAPAASPLFGDLSNLPPLLIEVSDTELLYPEAVQLRERWAAAGNRVQLNISRGLPHGWQMLRPFVPEARESLQRAASFAQRH